MPKNSLSNAMCTCILQTEQHYKAMVVRMVKNVDFV